MAEYHNDFKENGADAPGTCAGTCAPAWDEQPVTLPLGVYTSMREQAVRLIMERDGERQARFRAEAELARRRESDELHAD